MTPLTVGVDLDADSFETGLEKLPGMAKKAAGGVAAAWAGATVAVGGAAVKMSADFEDSMKAVDAKLDKTIRSKLPQLKKAIMDLPPELGEATDLANALTEALNEGADSAKAMDILTAAARLSKAAVSDLGETTKGLTRLMNAYGQETASAGELSAWMFETGDVDELAAGIGKVASNAALAGISQKELLSGLALLKDRGMSAEESMKAMSAAVRGFLDPGDKARETAESLGIHGFGRAQIEAKGFVGALEEIDQKTGGSVEKIGLLFGSVENAAGVTKLAADNAQDYKDKIEAMGGAAEKQDAAFVAQTSSFNAKMAALKVGVDKLLIGLGDEYLPKITEVVQGLLDNLDKLKILLDVIVMPLKAIEKVYEAGKSFGRSAKDKLDENAKAEWERIDSAQGGPKTYTEAPKGGEEMNPGSWKNYQRLPGDRSSAVAPAVPPPSPAASPVVSSPSVGGGPPVGGGTGTGTGAAPRSGAPSMGKLSFSSMPGAAGYLPGGESADHTLPGGGGVGGEDPFSVIEKLANKAADAGVSAGVTAGAKTGAAKASGAKGSKDQGSIYSNFATSASSAIVDGFMSGDVKDGIKNFGKGLADTAKSMLGGALKEILSGLLGGGGGFLGKMFKADGGPVDAGKPYIVGERRAELFVPKVPGRIMPSVGSAGQGGGGVHVENLYLTAGAGPGGVQSVEDIARQLGALARSGRGDYFPREIQARRQ